jgi:hypothetical protein
MGMSFFGYLKKAFTIKWNLLSLGAATVVGIISGYPNVILPLALAAEIIFLSGLATNHKFQAAMDVEVRKEKNAGQHQKTQLKTRQMLETLPLEDQLRFEKLKSQCVELKQIASKVKGHTDDSDLPMGDLQSKGMNRLLWIYLRLLYSRSAIERFFQTIDKKQIQKEIDHAMSRLASLGPTDDDSPNDKRRRASLEDQLRTSNERLANYEMAKENHEFIKDELARLSSKIASLAERAVNRQDPNFITSEVDSVSASVASSEKAMSELDFLTDWSGLDEAAPDLMADETHVEVEG